MSYANYLYIAIRAAIKTVKLKNGKFVLFINLYRKFSFQCP